MAKRYIKSTLRQAAAIVPVTKSMIAGNLNFLAHPRQIVYPIYNGLPDQIAKPDQRTSRSCIRIVYLANLILEKGWLLLFRAARVICREFANVSFEFYGEPDADSQKLLAVFETDNPSPERIRYKGPVYGDEKNSVLQNMDIFCFPSYYKLETFGVVNLEAMRAGKPIITTRHSGLPEIVIDKLGGFVVEPRRLDELLQKLRVLIRDEDLRRRMGAFNREKYLSEFTLNVHVQNWLHLISLLREQTVTTRNEGGHVRH
jgi:glycosyltransferase involved in cell wall biosynthesis